MGVVDGQDVSAAVTNPAFIDANADDTGVGKYTLNNSDPVSGTSITNIQREHNSIASFVGKSVNTSKTDVPTYTNNQGFTANQPVATRADSLTAKFHNSTGHTHDGSSGNGSPISSASIVSTQLRGYFLQATDLTGVVGTSTVVTTQLTGKTASTSSVVKGVVVTAPQNTVVLRQATGSNQGDQFVDGAGNIVYGRVTFSASVWTLSYYVLLAGTETAYSFSSSDVRWYYQELYNPIVDAPVYSELAIIPSDNVTADIVDATPTQRGAVSTGTQSFGGIKTFSDTTDSSSATTGSLMTSGGLGVAKKSFHGDNIGITNAKSLDLYELASNGTMKISLRAPDALAADVPLVLPDVAPTAGKSLYAVDGTTLAWRRPGWVWSTTSTISAGGTLSTSTGVELFNQAFRVTGNAGAVTMSTTPFGTTSWPDGVEFFIVGQHSTNTVTIPYADIDYGCMLNGDKTLFNGSTITLVWDLSSKRFWQKGAA